MFTRHHDVHDETDTTNSTTDRVDRTDPTDERVTGRHAAEHSLAEDAGYDAAHARYGGMNAGADFFGWLVAVASAVLMMGVVGAFMAAAATQAWWNDVDWTQDPSEREAGTIGLVAAVVLLVVAAVSYYAGGYVAGRMSRFDGGRQGFGVWLIGLLAMALGIGVGAAFGTQYNVLDRIDLPQLPFSDFEASMGAAITGGVFLLVTLVAALAGGKAGRRYHHLVDAAHLEPTVRSDTRN
jgi:hypothetical protein